MLLERAAPLSDESLPQRTTTTNQTKENNPMLKKLRQQLADARAKANALNATAERENRVLNADEQKEFDALIAECKDLQAKIASQEALQDLERSASGSSVIEVGDDRATKKPYRGIGEQLSVIARGQVLLESGRVHQADPRFQAALGTSETVPSDGGFLVEPEYSADLLKRTYNTGEIASRCKPLKMNSARLTINAVDEQSRQDGKRWGGILSYWLAEAQTYAGTKPKFDQRQLVANKLIALIYATEELLEDTAMLESFVDDAVPQEFAFQRDNAIFQGSGAGQPLGFLNHPSTVVVPYASGEGTSGTGPSTTDILNMWSRMWAPLRKNAVWFINQSIEPSLYPLTLGAPSLAQILIYTPPGVNGNNSAYGMMFGRPVIPIEHAAAVGVQGDISLWSPDGYLLADRQEVRADSSIHVAFLTGEKAFRWMLRCDGQPWWKQPLQPYYSTGATAPPTLAPAVVLETR
jgi:HK97 family phage major capsid protein